VKISLKVEYACRVLTQLAQTRGQEELPHIEGLARAEDIPANYLVQILNELRSNGLIVSRRGKQGGYALSREPSAISIADIFNAIDGELLEFTALERGESGENVKKVWMQVVKEFQTITERYTLDDFVRGGNQEMYFI
jgi:Rrf2 family protein